MQIKKIICTALPYQLDASFEPSSISLLLMNNIIRITLKYILCCSSGDKTAKSLSRPRRPNTPAPRRAPSGTSTTPLPPTTPSSGPGPYFYYCLIQTQTWIPIYVKIKVGYGCSIIRGIFRNKLQGGLRLYMQIQINWYLEFLA